MDETLKTRILGTFSGASDVAAVAVYGSAAKGRMRAASDIDVALLASDGQPFTVDRLAALNLALASATGREIDLVDLSGARGTLLAEILKHGVFLKNDNRRAYSALLKRNVYDQADFMPGYRRMLQRRRERFLNA